MDAEQVDRVLEALAPEDVAERVRPQQKTHQAVESGPGKPDRGRAKLRDTPKRLASRTPSPSGYSVCPSEASTTAESCSKQESLADLSAVSDPVECVENLHELEDAPVKNTFVHFPVEYVDPSDISGGRLKRSASAPSVLLTSPFERFTMPELHALGRCSPCAYLHAKADSCRQGSACKFCHLCGSDEIKKRKKQRLREIRARKAAMKASEPAEQGVGATA